MKGMQLLLCATLCATLPVTWMSGCAYVAPVVPPLGSGFNQTRAPLDINYNGTVMGGRAGKASAHSVVFGLFSFGDASVGAAAKEKGITRIDYADAEFLNVLGLYTKYTTIVYGE